MEAQKPSSPEGWAPIGARKQMRGQGPIPVPGFPSCSPDSFTHCFLLTMKNRDLSGSVLIDSRRMDLPKQTIRLTRSSSSPWEKWGSRDLLQSTKPLSQLLSPVIIHSFIHSYSKQSEHHNFPESKLLVFWPGYYPRIPGGKSYLF